MKQSKFKICWRPLWKNCRTTTYCWFWNAHCFSISKCASILTRLHILLNYLAVKVNDLFWGKIRQAKKVHRQQRQSWTALCTLLSIRNVPTLPLPQCKLSTVPWCYPVSPHTSPLLVSYHIERFPFLSHRGHGGRTFFTNSNEQGYSQRNSSWKHWLHQSKKNIEFPKILSAVSPSLLLFTSL